MRIGHIVQHQVHPADARHGAVVIETDKICTVVDGLILLRCSGSTIGAVRGTIPFQHEVFLRRVFAHQMLLGAKQKTARASGRVNHALAGLRVE